MTDRPATSQPASTGRTYWQSFEHLANSPEVAEALDKEFQKYDPDVIKSLSRRKFLKYAAASMALAGVGLSGCRRWPKEALAPYAHQPVGLVPGLPEYYATSYEVGGVGSGLLAESFDGRPIKLEGNPSHPYNRTRSYDPAKPGTAGRGWGSADSFAQAQPLSLYDPERSRTVVDNSGATGVARDAAYFDETVLPQLQQALQAGRLAVLSEATASPTAVRLLGELPDGAWYTWEPLSTQPTNGVREIWHFDQAQVVLGLDVDYLGTHPGHTRYAADWSVMRASADDEGHPVMSKCYQAECRYSLTGASADTRLPIRPALLDAVARLVAEKVGVSLPAASLESLREGEQAKIEAFATDVAADLTAAGSAGLVAAGPEAPESVRNIARAINAQLGSVGTTVTYIADPTPVGGTIDELAAAVRNGEVDALVILGGNPVYDAPADVDFAGLLGDVGMSVHLSPYLDETSLAASYHVPRAHFLECWGDTRGFDGTVACQQPLILPLFNGVSSIEMLARLLGLEKADGMSLVAETFAGLNGSGDEKAWRKFLHDGVLADTGAEQADAPDAGDLSLPAAVDGTAFEVVFQPDTSVHDGRFANNGWLQELPDPLTKLCWDNAALMNIRDAEANGLHTGDMIAVSVNGRSLEMAVYVLPGQPRGTIGLPLGYGRRAGGTLAVASDPDTGGGFDTYRLRTLAGGLTYAGGATVERADGRYLLAMTQNHHLIDDVGYKGRGDRVGYKGETSTVIHESSFEDHLHFLHPEEHEGDAHGGGHGGGHGHGHPAHSAAHASLSLQIFQPPSTFNYPHAWGMTIDMNACMGCSACVVACQSENNIPVVGKESVLNNREMHWLRIDRYFKAEGDDTAAKKHDEDPDVVWQPMMCVHCENAPCEQVCPVAATVHDTEGLNTMVYNRCIGTRYCSNNCPYKVRRFNYFDYHSKLETDSFRSTGTAGGISNKPWLMMPDQQQVQQIDQIRRMVFNPDVTVRMRGVMEKCTYCTQRISRAKIEAKARWAERKTLAEQMPDGQEKQDLLQELADYPYVEDGAVVTACQAACPTEAITFGNLNDPSTKVSQIQNYNDRSYSLLEELNSRPRTKHLAVVRNPAEAASQHEAAETH